MTRTTLALFLVAFVGCSDREPPPRPAPDAAPAPAPPDAGAARDARLGMMERHAIWKAKKEADAKLAAELAAQEQTRLIKFDRARLAKHAALLAFVKKSRAQLDSAATRLRGKLVASAEIEKLKASQRKAIEAQAKALAALDPKGGNSNITTDHDMNLNFLANEYPAAIVASFEGDEKPLAAVRAEMDKRQEKIESWLARIKK
jgi:multidrug efflux pump subunit AcrA (membrane-fusion protein)